MAEASPDSKPFPQEAPGASAPPVRTGWKAVVFHPITKFLCKLGLAAGLLTWLATSGNLDFKVILQAENDWLWILACVGLMLPTHLLASYRFKILLDGLEMPCPYFRALAWTMIGNFFNVAMPSATGGDVVKVFYVAGAYPREKRAVAVLTVLLDRVLGLFGLFFLALVVCLAGGHTVSDNPRLANVTFVLTLICAGVVVAFFILASRSLEESPLRKRFVAALPFGSKLEKLYMSFAGLRRRPGLMAGTLVLSMFNHAFLTASMIALAYGLNMDFVKENLVGTMIVIPLCTFFKVFGVAGGFGTGEVAAKVLFQEVLGTAGSTGSTLMLVFNVLSLLVCIVVGLPFYLLTGKAQPQGEIYTSEPEHGPAAADAKP